MSDIFENYAKIMSDKGLVKKAQRSEETKTRPQGVDLEAIEMLYHVKPNGKDEKTIVEQAHPNSVYVAPAYDRFNGLVENIQERQNMMIDIALKPNHGKLTHHRYVKANAELLQEVIKAGFLLDNRGEEQLMSLADGCAEKLTNSESKEEVIKKQAFLGLLARGLIRVIAPMLGKKFVEKHLTKRVVTSIATGADGLGYLAALVGLTNGVNEGINLSAGLVKDCESLIGQIDDVINPEFWKLEFEVNLSEGDRQLLLEISSQARELMLKGKEAITWRRALSKELKKFEDQDSLSAEKFFQNKYHSKLKSFFTQHMIYIEKMASFFSRAEHDVADIHQSVEGSGDLTVQFKRLISDSPLQDVIKAIKRVNVSLQQEAAVTAQNINGLNGTKEESSKLQQLVDKVKEQGEAGLDMIKEKTKGLSPGKEKITEDIPEVNLDELLETQEPPAGA